MSISSKLILAIFIAVAAVAVSGSYVTLRSVDTTSCRLRSVYADRVLPLWVAEEASEACDEMDANVYRALTTERIEQTRALTPFREAQKSFERDFARYEKELTIVTQPGMQDLLRKYDALEDQNGREQKATATVRRTYDMISRGLVRVFDLRGADHQAEALEFYGREVLRVPARALSDLAMRTLLKKPPVCQGFLDWP